MKPTNRPPRQLIELGSARRETRGGGTDIYDQTLRQPFAGLGLL